MSNQMMDLIIKMVFCVISILITGYFIPWLRAKMNKEEYAELLIFIEKCVEAAEKIYTPEEWKNKKKYVLNLAEEKLDSLGIEVTEEELNALIEGFVKAVKG